MECCEACGRRVRGRRVDAAGRKWMGPEKITQVEPPRPERAAKKWECGCVPQPLQQPGSPASSAACAAAGARWDSAAMKKLAHGDSHEGSPWRCNTCKTRRAEHVTCEGTDGAQRAVESRREAHNAGSKRENGCLKLKLLLSRRRGSGRKMLAAQLGRRGRGLRRRGRP